MTVKTKDVQKADEARPVTRMPTYMPEVDIYEKPDALLVIADVPGVVEKDVDIQLEGDVLTITATQSELSLDGYKPILGSYQRGVFKRTFTLNSEVDREKISATIRQGVLHLELPKSPAAQPRRIEVRAG